MNDQVELLFGYPSKVAAMLLNNDIDVGLIPVAAIPFLKEHYIISDHCIGASQAVASVCLFSEVPLDQIEIILLDYQSRTSAALLKLLLKDHWKIAPELLDTKDEYRELIKGTTAGLVIGDRALQQRKHSAYIYDLAQAWREMTGLPFLFAVWVANKKLPEAFTTSFNKTTAEGLQHIPEIVAANPFPDYDLNNYYTKNIDYRLDGGKKKAMELFLKKITEI